MVLLIVRLSYRDMREWGRDELTRGSFDAQRVVATHRH